MNEYLKNKALETNEFDSLRNEMHYRVKWMLTSGFSVITAVLAVWAIAGLLFTNLYGLEISENSENLTNILLFGKILLCTLLAIPVVMIAPLSIKAKDNFYQIASIGAYIRVFFELPTILREKENGTFYGWETYHIHKTNSKFFNLFNLEFIVVSGCSLLALFGFSAFMLYYEIVKNNIKQCIVLSVVLLILFTVGIFCVIVTYKNSKVKNYLSNKDSLLNLYLKRAVYDGFITIEEKTAYEQILAETENRA